MAERAPFKGILFDKDGVLVDFDKTWIGVLVTMAKGLAAGDRVHENALLDVAGYERKTGKCRPGSIWAAGNNDELIAAWQEVGTGRDDAGLNRFIEAECLKATPVPVGSLEALGLLFAALKKAGFVLGIATNDFAASAQSTMAHFGLLDDLTCIFGYDSVANPKPAGDCVEVFAEKTGIAPRDIVVVGDNAHDMEMARNGGAGLAVGVLSGNSRHDQLAPLADFVIDDVTGLMQVLKMDEKHVL